METTAHPDRRRFERVPHRADCRVLDPRTGRFLPGRSCDYSVGGARVEVRHARGFEPGQVVALLLPTGEHGGVVHAREAVRGMVRRVLPGTGGREEIGLEFERAA